ncbi:MAG: TIM barrel protein [Pseudomonadota bacterium]
MPQFSANLGFLFTEFSLPDAIRAAAHAGFDAVEMHYPYNVPAAEVKAVLAETGLPVMSINTERGDTSAGENGLAAVPGREREARESIDQAISYAAEVGALHVHVLAGIATGEATHTTFLSNLRYACKRAQPHGIGVLIEPLNRYDAPGYFLSTAEQAADILGDVDDHRAKLMFDCYHMQIMGGDLTNRLRELLPIIGHIQFASVPDRGPPDMGEVDFVHIFAQLDELGWDAPLGAEYKPNGATVDTLGWMQRLR